MDFDEVKDAMFPVIEDNDSLKASKRLQVKHWCSAFLKFFDKRSERELFFFLDVLTDEDCWENTETAHCVKLNRRVAAKKMSEPRSWKGTINPLDDFERYQLACWCCLEEEVITLFQHFKQQSEISTDDSHALTRFTKSLSGDLDYLTDSMMEFWTHLVSGCISELNLEGRHLFVYGLDCAMGKMFFKHVEAVEFFWLKVKALPENELSTQEKDEILMKTIVHASASPCGGQPEIYEFCFSQINPDKYRELLRRDFEANSYYASFNRLKNVYRYDLFQKLYDCLKPSEISEEQYYHWLRLLKIEKCPQHYEYVVVKLFLHMWMKERFDKHRLFVLKEEMTSLSMKGKLLVPLVMKNFMELVWAMLDKAEIPFFMQFEESREMENISLVLLDRDPESLSKFLSYFRVSPSEGRM